MSAAIAAIFMRPLRLRWTMRSPIHPEHEPPSTPPMA
jgi:hypothetical protein